MVKLAKTFDKRKDAPPPKPQPGHSSQTTTHPQHTAGVPPPSPSPLVSTPSRPFKRLYATSLAESAASRSTHPSPRSRPENAAALPQSQSQRPVSWPLHPASYSEPRDQAYTWDAHALASHNPRGRESIHTVFEQDPLLDGEFSRSGNSGPAEVPTRLPAGHGPTSGVDETSWSRRKKQPLPARYHRQPDPESAVAENVKPVPARYRRPGLCYAPPAGNGGSPTTIALARGSRARGGSILSALRPSGLKLFDGNSRPRKSVTFGDIPNSRDGGDAELMRPGGSRGSSNSADGGEYWRLDGDGFPSLVSQVAVGTRDRGMRSLPSTSESAGLCRDSVRLVIRNPDVTFGRYDCTLR